VDGSGPITAVSRSNLEAYAGSFSLQVSVDLTAAGANAADVSTSPVPSAGQTVTLHVYVPATQGLQALLPFVKEGPPNYRFTGGWVDPGQLTLGWNTMTVTVPADAVPLYQVGLQVNSLSGGAADNRFYIDTVSW
jgi:hypothetical protein